MNKKGKIISSLVIIVLLVVIVALLAVQLSIFSLSSITGGAISIGSENSEIISQKYGLDDFSKIHITHRGDVILTQGNDYDIVIEAQEKVIDDLRVRVDGETLLISKQKNILFDNSPITIFITMPDIEEIRVSGSADVIGKNEFDGRNLAVIISGSGSADLEVDVDFLTSRISGSGNIVYSGFAEEHSIIVSGSGDLKALDLITELSDVVVSGSGDVTVFSKDELSIVVSGSGEVTYRGATPTTQRVSGSGSIQKLS